MRFRKALCYIECRRFAVGGTWFLHSRIVSVWGWDWVVRLSADSVVDDGSSCRVHMGTLWGIERRLWRDGGVFRVECRA